MNRWPKNKRKGKKGKDKSILYSQFRFRMQRVEYFIIFCLMQAKLVNIFSTVVFLSFEYIFCNK